MLPQIKSNQSTLSEFQNADCNKSGRFVCLKKSECDFFMSSFGISGWIAGLWRINYAESLKTELWELFKLLLNKN